MRVNGAGEAVAVYVSVVAVAVCWVVLIVGAALGLEGVVRLGALGMVLGIVSTVVAMLWSTPLVASADLEASGAPGPVLQCVECGATDGVASAGGALVCRRCVRGVSSRVGAA